MKQLICVLALSLSFTACRVHLVPGYDNEIVKQITSSAKATDKLFFLIEEAEGEGRAYSKFTEKYTDIRVELNDLLRKETARYKGEDLVKITENLIATFQKYRDRHKLEDSAIKNAVLALQREYMNAQFDALLAAEKALPVK